MKKTTEQFVKDAQQVHRDKYDYSFVNYIGAHNKVKIICPIHGEFEQRPGHHLSGCGCRSCAREKAIVQITLLQQQNTENKRLTTVQFIERATIIHNNQYDYSLVHYTSIHNKVKIICPIHGEFEQRAVKHLSQHCGCPKCGDTQAAQKRVNTSANKFEDRAKLIHKDLYDYSDVKYEHARKHVHIICKKHGVFIQSPNSHLNGSGCPKCNVLGGYNQKLFNSNPHIKNNPSVLYFIHLFSPTETFYKIGITTRPIQERIQEIQKYYSVNILCNISLPLYQAYITEQQVLAQFQIHQYQPTILFEGHTECLTFLESDVVFIQQQIQILVDCHKQLA